MIINSTLNKFKRKFFSVKHDFKRLNSSNSNEYYFKKLKGKILSLIDSHPLGDSPWEENCKELRLNLVKEKLGDGKDVLLIATWSISEMPFSLRKAILNNLPNDYRLIAFQESFDGLENVSYFNKLVKEKNAINFKIQKISHLPGNSYLIGARHNNQTLNIK